MITIIEKWWRSTNVDASGGVVLANLSKAFDCIDHELLIAKLYAYGFDKNSLCFINLYLKGWKQSTKNIPFIVSSHSFGFTSGFNFFLTFTSATSHTNVTNYADENTP